MALLIFEQGAPRDGRPVMRAPFIAQQSVAIGGTSATSNAFSTGTGLITVCASDACHVVIGPDPEEDLAATTSDFPLGAGERADFLVEPGHVIAVIEA